MFLFTEFDEYEMGLWIKNVRNFEQTFIFQSCNRVGLILKEQMVDS
jgi:hypothetical protein